MNIQLLFVIILIIIIISLYVFSVKKSSEKNLELNRITLNDEYGYAHFSKIDSKNINQFPDFNKCKPLRYTLHKGEFLFIPKNWWHWVKSYGKTIGINNWYYENNNKEPYVDTFYWNSNVLWTDEYLSNKIKDDIEVWDQNTNKGEITNFSKFAQKKEKDKYLITLKAYFNNNNKLLDLLKDDIDMSYFKEVDGKFNYNIWISYNDVETKLHYDDYDGILYVVDGIKEVILYSPENSKYIPAYNATPSWVNLSVNFQYNIHKFLPDYKTNAKLVASSILLYKSLKCGNARRHVYDIISNIYKQYKSNKVVWGIKNSISGDIRWEFYFYNISNDPNFLQLNSTISKDWYKNSFAKNIINTSYEPDDKNVMIHSFDVYPTYTGDELHLWYNRNENTVSLPLLGEGIYIKNNELFKESMFNIFNQNEIPLNILNTPFTFKHVMKYKCKNVAIYDKYNNKYGIQYFGISQDDFISFLHEYNWNADFIDYYNSMKIHYSVMEHEITINYIFENNEFKVIGTSLYGFL